MASHPEIKLVSRDRGGDYASAATAGAPQAVESRRSLPRVEEFGGSIGGVSLSPSGDQTKDPNAKNACRTSSHRGSTSPSQAFSPSVERLQQAYREERVTRYEQVVALRKLGMSHTAIAERVGMGESTESLWLAAGAYPETTRGPYVSRVDPYLPYLFQRWESGCHNMVRLHQELLAQGYRGSYASVRNHLVRRLPVGKKNAAKGNNLSPSPLLSRQATFLFLARPEQLDTEEQETVRQLRQSHPEVDLAYDLVQQFAQMLRTRKGKDLDDWLALALASQIPELQSFVQGIKRDKDDSVGELLFRVVEGIS